MKVLNIVFVILGLPVLISGFMELANGDDGVLLGFQIDSPWYGILHIAMGSGMLLAAFDYFRKKK
jgi:hypothetical protein